MATQPTILREMEALPSIERVKCRILDLQDLANNNLRNLLELKMHKQRNIQFEKLFLSSVLAFAFELKPKMEALSRGRKLGAQERAAIAQNADAVSYYVRKYSQLTLDIAIDLLEALNETCDMLGISSVMRPTPRTFEGDIQNV